MKQIYLVAALALWAAHPHVFIDTGIEVIFDAEGRAEALRITWTYDDLISLALLSDRGMDEDFDGVLTPAELAALNGFDMQWQPGVTGDTYALLGDAALNLSGPSDWTVSYATQRSPRHTCAGSKPLSGWLRPWWCRSMTQAITPPTQLSGSLC